MSATEMRLTLPSYTGLVMSSRSMSCAVPLVVLESLEAGIPVVAYDGNGGADLIRSTGCGGVYSDQEPDDLVDALTAVLDGGGSMRERARLTWRDHFSARSRVTATLQTYEKAGAGG
jgi:glycosyltransferase involved in cell wall biosynthesis